MRKTVTKLYGPNEKGEVYEYFEGYCDSSEVATLPTNFVADGSNVITSDQGDWYFFNEESKSWGAMLNIQG